MAKNEKKLVRNNFRKIVFERDNYKCRVCGKLGEDRQTGFSKHKGKLEELDAHHICDRHLLPNGGYVLENGISLCSECHLKAESHWKDGSTPVQDFSPDDLYRLIDSSLEKAQEASVKFEI